MLSRDDIMRADDCKTESVDVPEWGGTVLVRALSGSARDDWEASFVDRSGKKAKVKPQNIRARLAVRSIVDENGNRIFSDDDAERLGEKSAAALERIFVAASRLSRIGEEDIEDLEKNSGSGPSADSGSG